MDFLEAMPLSFVRNKKNYQQDGRPVHQTINATNRIYEKSEKHWI